MHNERKKRLLTSAPQPAIINIFVYNRNLLI